MVSSWLTRSHPGDDPKLARDLTAPDAEPTDEELALVMREARDLAMERRKISDAWIAARLEEASRFAREHSLRRKQDGDDGS